jgi:hypothetical protein
MGRIGSAAAIVEDVMRVAANSGANTSSMLADVQRGTTTEIAAINGVLIREAQRLGVPTPTHQMLTGELGLIPATAWPSHASAFGTGLIHAKSCRTPLPHYCSDSTTNPAIDLKVKNSELDVMPSVQSIPQGQQQARGFSTSSHALSDAMQMVTTVDGARNFRAQNSGTTIGLVPTMGGLHEGHLTLIKVDGHPICQGLIETCVWVRRLRRRAVW